MYAIWKINRVGMTIDLSNSFYLKLILEGQQPIRESIRGEEVQVVILVARSESLGVVDAKRLQGCLSRDLEGVLAEYVSVGVRRNVVEVVVMH